MEPGGGGEEGKEKAVVRWWPGAVSRTFRCACVRVYTDGGRYGGWPRQVNKATGIRIDDEDEG